jgi:hypothetical protein
MCQVRIRPGAWNYRVFADLQTIAAKLMPDILARGSCLAHGQIAITR